MMNIARDAADIRKVLADLGLAFGEALELELRSEADQRTPLKLRDLLSLRERFRHALAVHLRELRFVVEGFQMRRPARLIEEDDAPCLGRVMQRVHHAARLGHQRMQAKQSQARGALTQEGAAANVNFV